MMPPRLPVMLELIGPQAGSIEVRGVPFVQQPVVRVIGVDGRLYPDVTGSIVVGAFGTCAPTLQGQDTAELVGGIAIFTEARLDTVACLGEDIGIRAAVAEDLGGTVVSLGLATVSTDLFRIKHGAPHEADDLSGQTQLCAEPCPWRRADQGVGRSVLRLRQGLGCGNGL